MNCSPILTKGHRMTTQSTSDWRDALDALYGAGLLLWAEEGRLGVGPEQRITPDLAAIIRAHRSELLAFVTPGKPAPELWERLHAAAARATAVRPRPTGPVEWPAAAADFCLLLTANDLPEVPSRLNGWTQVTDAAKMLRSLRADIIRGPSGPRDFYGALQADLLALQRFVLQAAKGEPQDCPRIDADGATRPQCIEPRPDASGCILGDVPRNSGKRRELATAPTRKKNRESA